MSFNTQPPEGGWAVFWGSDVPSTSVSTHSRPKAAGRFYERCWLMGSPAAFQHTAARRRLVGFGSYFCLYGLVSTHSRPKAAGRFVALITLIRSGFNTQPPEGGWVDKGMRPINRNGFNTQPPEGGWPQLYRAWCGFGRFNTQPPEGGWVRPSRSMSNQILFQHTAARRRLAQFGQ